MGVSSVEWQWLKCYKICVVEMVVRSCHPLSDEGSRNSCAFLSTQCRMIGVEKQNLMEIQSPVLFIYYMYLKGIILQSRLNRIAVSERRRLHVREILLASDGRWQNESLYAGAAHGQEDEAGLGACMYDLVLERVVKDCDLRACPSFETELTSSTSLECGSCKRRNPATVLSKYRDPVSRTRCCAAVQLYGRTYLP